MLAWDLSTLLLASSAMSSAVSSVAGWCNSGADEAEGVSGIGTQGRNSGDADHDDQGQHHGVLDGRRTIFLLEEGHDTLDETVHR